LEDAAGMLVFGCDAVLAERARGAAELNAVAAEATVAAATGASDMGIEIHGDSVDDGGSAQAGLRYLEVLPVTDFPTPSTTELEADRRGA